jgi:hypothetical protein
MQVWYVHNLLGDPPGVIYEPIFDEQMPADLRRAISSATATTLEDQNNAR